MVAAGAQPIGLKLFSGARNWRICGCMKNFLKMHGLGNDFIILDARGDSDFSASPAAARARGHAEGLRRSCYPRAPRRELGTRRR